MKRGHLDAANNAFNEFGANRFRYGLLKRVRQWGKFLGQQIEERDEMRSAIVEQHLVEGQEQIKPEDPSYNECGQDLTELFNEAVEGAPMPIRTTDFPDSMELSGTAFAILVELGVFEETDADSE